MNKKRKSGVLTLFRPVEKVGLDRPENEYYENISHKLGILQVLLYLSLLSFVVLAFFSNTELITYRNFYGFFKDLNASTEGIDVFNADSVTYPADEQQSFSLYRKGLAVAGNTSVSVFTATGRQTVGYNVVYRNPVSVGSGRYLLVYEMGGKQYSLYNSYTRLYSGVAERPITGAAVSGNGTFALISSSAEYSSAVYLYSSRFSLINEYFKNGYVMSVDINENGSLIAILTSAQKNGVFETTLMLAEPGESREKINTVVGDTLGLSCKITSSGAVSVLCSGGIRYLTDGGKTVTEYPFASSEAVCFDHGRDGVSVVLKGKNVTEPNRLVVFDKNGKLTYDRECIDVVRQISRSGNSVFLLGSEGIVRVNAISGRTASFSCNTGQKSILAVSENEVLLCSPQKATYHRIPL